MKYAEFPKVTRLIVVGKNGLVYEDHTLFKGGAEVRLSDGGHTLQVIPLTPDRVEGPTTP